MDSAKPVAVVVEDDLFLAEIYSDTLRGIGLDVKVFHDGNAMRQIRGLNPSLVILDLNLPVRSGLEVFQDLRKHPETTETWVIIVTANAAQASDLNRVENENQNLLILVKPVSVAQLEQLAQRLVFQQ